MHQYSWSSARGQYWFQKVLGISLWEERDHSENVVVHRWGGCDSPAWNALQNRWPCYSRAALGSAVFLGCAWSLVSWQLITWRYQHCQECCSLGDQGLSPLGVASGSLGRPEHSAHESSKDCQHTLRETLLNRSPGIPSGTRAHTHVLLWNSLFPASPSEKVLNALQTAVRTECEGQMQRRLELRVTSDFTSLSTI